MATPQNRDVVVRTPRLVDGANITPAPVTYRIGDINNTEDLRRLCKQHGLNVRGTRAVDKLINMLESAELTVDGVTQVWSKECADVLWPGHKEDHAARVSRLQRYCQGVNIDSDSRDSGEYGDDDDDNGDDDEGGDAGAANPSTSQVDPPIVEPTQPVSRLGTLFPRPPRRVEPTTIRATSPRPVLSHQAGPLSPPTLVPRSNVGVPGAFVEFTPPRHLTPPEPASPALRSARAAPFYPPVPPVSSQSDGYNTDAGPGGQEQPLASRTPNTPSPTSFRSSRRTANVPSGRSPTQDQSRAPNSSAPYYSAPPRPTPANLTPARATPTHATPTLTSPVYASPPTTPHPTSPHVNIPGVSPQGYITLPRPPLARSSSAYTRPPPLQRDLRTGSEQYITPPRSPASRLRSSYEDDPSGLEAGQIDQLQQQILVKDNEIQRLEETVTALGGRLDYQERQAHARDRQLQEYTSATDELKRRLEQAEDRFRAREAELHAMLESLESQLAEARLSYTYQGVPTEFVGAEGHGGIGDSVQVPVASLSEVRRLTQIISDNQDMTMLILKDLFRGSDEEFLRVVQRIIETRIRNMQPRERGGLYLQLAYFILGKFEGTSPREE